MRSIQARKSKRNLCAQTPQCKRCLQTLSFKDLPWYACNRGVVGTLVRIPSRDLKIHMGGAIILTTALSVSVLPSGGVVSNLGCAPRTSAFYHVALLPSSLLIRDSARITDMFYFPLFGKNSILADCCRPKVKIHYRKSALRF